MSDYPTDTDYTPTYENLDYSEPEKDIEYSPPEYEPPDLRINDTITYYDDDDYGIEIVFMIG